MGNNNTFERCIYCFAPKTEQDECPHCGYENGLCDMPGWWLTPGTVLKGRYVTGRNLNSTDTEITYLAWDLAQEKTVEIVEYFPEGSVTRDITHADEVVTIPGCEAAVETGRQAFFEKAKLFYNCVSRVEKDMTMDFFLRNNTCYYALKRRKRKQD